MISFIFSIFLIGSPNISAAIPVSSSTVAVAISSPSAKTTLKVSSSAATIKPDSILAEADTGYVLPKPPKISTDESLTIFEADEVDYSSPVIHMKGNVVIHQSTRTIKADQLWINQNTNIGTSKGFLIIKDSGSAISGNPGKYDFGTETGTLIHASAGYGYWQVHGETATVKPGQKAVYENADFTSCNVYPNPDYHFHSTHLLVVPNKYLLGYNTTFCLGKTPLFYMPFFYKSLVPKNKKNGTFHITSDPGYDYRNGYFLKNMAEEDWSKTLQTKEYLDYYSNEGVGMGGEIDHHESKNQRGSLYFYTIKENPPKTVGGNLISSGLRRWGVYGDEFDQLTSSLSFQARIQAQSDQNFNNDYARSNPYPVANQLINSSALVYRQAKYFARVSYSRVDNAYNPNGVNGGGFQTYSESAPRFDFQTVPLKFKHDPLINTFSAFEDNTTQQGQPFLQHSAGINWQGSNVYRMGCGVNFTPTIQYSGTYYSKTNPLSPYATNPTAISTNAFINNYSASGDLRLPTIVGDVDVIQSMTGRSRMNSFGLDSNAPDHGIQSEMATLEDVYTFSPTSMFRITSGYNEQQVTNQPIPLNQRIQPIAENLTYVTHSGINITQSNTYQFDGGEQSFQLNAMKGAENGTHFGISAGYAPIVPGVSPQTYTVNTDFGWAPASGTWHVFFITRSQAVSNAGVGQMQAFALYDKELTVVKLWHDFIGTGQFLFRPGNVKQVSFNITLRLPAGGPPTSKAQQQQTDWESEWYPQRQRPMTRL